MAESKGSAAIEAERPKIIAAFLPAGEPEKRTEEVDFFAALEPCIREGMEDKVKPLLDQLTSARAGLVWALDKDRTLVEHDEIVGKLKAYLALLKGFRGPAGSAGFAAAPAAPAAAPAAPPAAEAPAEAAEVEAKQEGEAEKEGDGAAEAAASAAPAAQDAGGSGPELRRALSFTWRDVMDTDAGRWSVGDTVLEEACACLAISQRLLTKAVHTPLRDDTINALYRMLRECAGILAHARSLTSLSGCAPADLPLDLRSTLCEAWAELSLAQAQHATLFRASSQPHIAFSLMASLCRDTQVRYQGVLRRHTERLASGGAGGVAAWAGKAVVKAMLSAHLDFKSSFFGALARYCQAAQRLGRADLDEGSCAQAVRALRAAAEEMEEAKSKAKAYQDVARAVVYVDRTLLADLEESGARPIRGLLERAEQLNASVFFKNIPEEPEEMPSPRTMVAPTPFDDPPPSPLWTPEVYAALDASRAPERRLGPVPSDERCCVLS